MNCKKCNHAIGELLACANCARVASAIETHKRGKRIDQVNADAILRGVSKLWFNRCRCGGEEQIHLAMEWTIDHRVFAFCGHEISLGAKCDGMSGGLGPLEPKDLEDPIICRLCIDFIVSRGSGICADVCQLCGRSDSKHRRGCILKPLEDQELVAKLGGVA